MPPPRPGWLRRRPRRSEMKIDPRRLGMSMSSQEHSAGWTLLSRHHHHHHQPPPLCRSGARRHVVTVSVHVVDSGFPPPGHPTTVRPAPNPPLFPAPPPPVGPTSAGLAFRFRARAQRHEKRPRVHAVSTPIFRNLAYLSQGTLSVLFPIPYPVHG